MGSLAKPPLYTIGHSTRTVDELVSALRAFGISTLVDIRHFTRSRANPQFNEETLAPLLRQHGIAYVAMPALGGRRGKSKSADPARNAGWEHAAFKSYADYAETPPFRDAFEQLLALAAEARCAVMCAEAVWWRCHRRIVADYALARGLEVFHVFTEAKADRAQLTPFARVDRQADTVCYPSDAAAGEGSA